MCSGPPEKKETPLSVQSIHFFFSFRLLLRTLPLRRATILSLSYPVRCSMVFCSYSARGAGRKRDRERVIDEYYSRVPRYWDVGRILSWPYISYQIQKLFQFFFFVAFSQFLGTLDIFFFRGQYLFCIKNSILLVESWKRSVNERQVRRTRPKGSWTVERESEKPRP